MSSFLKYWLPLLFWASLISIFSSDSFSSDNTSPLFLPLFQWLLPHATPELIESFHYLVRKLGHFTEFFILVDAAVPSFAERARDALAMASGWLDPQLGSGVCDCR